MQITRPLGNEFLIKYSGEHVLYELEMFFWLVNQVQIGWVPKEHQKSLNNSLIESACIHFRNILQFLYDRPNPSDDKIVGADFFDDPNQWLDEVKKFQKPGKEWGRTDLEIAHLTAKRIFGETSEKDWNFKELYSQLRPILQCFAQKASPSKLSPVVLKFISNW